MSLIQWHFVGYRSYVDYPGLEAGIVVLFRAIIIIIIIIMISCDLSFFCGTYPVSAPSLRFHVADCGPSLIVCGSQYSLFPPECIECLLGVFFRSSLAVVIILVSSVLLSVSFSTCVEYLYSDFYF